MPNEAERPRRVSVDRDGPVLIEGPVELVTDDGTVVTSDRFLVAVCTCRRSRIYPWCDTSHRRHKRPQATDGDQTERADAGTGRQTHDRPDGHDRSRADDRPEPGSQHHDPRPDPRKKP
ncbi:CDGSH iron-sulfur domain-containing protein [Streptomyces sp. NPDC092369]|uniref:CDGSH iron-sulfur domain-containing protein n=1 Tax=Streptomyces sp. NPDC092369 TaxID=3366015 RepID=UPI0037F50E01